MAFRVMRRDADEASTPRYQAATRVLSRPKASTAMATPTTVSVDRSLWRKAFRKMSFRTNMRGLGIGRVNSLLPQRTQSSPRKPRSGNTDLLGGLGDLGGEWSCLHTVSGQGPLLLLSTPFSR